MIEYVCATCAAGSYSIEEDGGYGVDVVEASTIEHGGHYDGDAR